MKKLFTTLLLCMLITTCALPVHAASNPKLKDVTYYQKTAKTVYVVDHLKKTKSNYWWENSIYDANFSESGPKLISCTSSNPKVAVVETNTHGDDDDSWGNGYFWVKKPGKATLKTVFEYNQKKYTYVTKLTVLKWENPLKSLKIGKTSFQSKFKKDNKFYCGTPQKGKLSITPKSNWKLKKIRLLKYDGEHNKSLKNNTTLNLSATSEACTLEITLQNRKTKQLAVIEMPRYNFAG